MTVLGLGMFGHTLSNDGTPLDDYADSAREALEADTTFPLMATFSLHLNTLATTPGTPPVVQEPADKLLTRLADLLRKLVATPAPGEAELAAALEKTASTDKK